MPLSVGDKLGPYEIVAAKYRAPIAMGDRSDLLNRS
jgi:hypothetical protein